MSSITTKLFFIRNKYPIREKYLLKLLPNFVKIFI